MLVNNAGLTLTYICPDLYRRPTPPKFWEASDEVVQNVMDANYVAADKLARRVAPIMVKQGWGRIINVTTMLATMSRVGFSPYGPSKAALEMATWVWAKELEHSGVTANIVNPGAGANTPGMAEEIRHKSREGSIDRLVEPEEMVPPLLWVVSREADKVNGMRYDAKQWDASLPPAEAARRCGRPAGFALREPSEPPSGPIIAVAVALWEPQSPEAFWAGGMIGNRSAELLGSFAPPSAMPTSSIVLQNLSTHVANNWLRPLIVTRARAGCSL
jgi:3-oxoacyl-[acyl-carrier protein] reductase